MKAVSAVIFAIAVSVPHAQTVPAFEVASVRPSSPDANRVRLEFSAGRLSAQSCTLAFIIEQAYSLRDFQLVGGPAWTLDGTGARFDIHTNTAPAASNEQLRAMTQVLLADRFHLKVHRETRSVQVYALVIAKGGPKLQAAKPGEARNIESYPGHMGGTNVDMPLFIDEFSNKVDRQVIDKTELSSHFDFSLRWSPDAAGRADPGLSSAFTAIQEQLGLRLEPRKLPVEVLVIDHVERPSAN